MLKTASKILLVYIIILLSVRIFSLLSNIMIPLFLLIFNYILNTRSDAANYILDIIKHPFYTIYLTTSIIALVFYLERFRNIDKLLNSKKNALVLCIVGLLLILIFREKIYIFSFSVVGLLSMIVGLVVIVSKYMAIHDNKPE